MSRLPLGTATGFYWTRLLNESRFVDERLQARGLVTPAATLVVAPHHCGNVLRSKVTFVGEVLEQQFDQSAERDAVRMALARKEPRRETAELGE